MAVAAEQDSGRDSWCIPGRRSTTSVSTLLSTRLPPTSQSGAVLSGGSTSAPTLTTSLTVSRRSRTGSARKRSRQAIFPAVGRCSGLSVRAGNGRNIAPADPEDDEADRVEASADSGLDTANVSRGGPRAFSSDLQVVGFGGGRWQTHSDLGEEAAIRAGFMAEGGWHSLKTGTTRTPAGRPRRGVQGKRLRDDIERDLYPIDVLREVRGKQDRRSRAIRDHLAIWLYVRGAVRRKALADLIGYDRKTIDRLHRKGQRMLELLEQINGKLDVAIERLRATNPTSEEITEAIDELIAGVLGEAA